jgi:NADH dehydrogenase FAD-containing subunit
MIHSFHSSKQEDGYEKRSFDFVIVGAGPSAIGLLYGLLERYNDSSEPPNFTVAVIERGTGPPHDPSTQSPSNWYEAAHNLTSTSASHISTQITGRIMDLLI